ncbi:hypothetical protein RintRC_7069 [Richelia intracellularis]|nr:hypothetical protein RintRC_7069 [Richelia intracellularis]
MNDSNTHHTNELTGVMDRSKRDRFELLSAYLDGEVTAVERKQVEQWLAEDETVQGLYARLLKIRRGIHNLPVPPQKNAEETATRVFSRLRRTRLKIISGATAIAACAITAVTGVVGEESSIPQMAQQQSSEQPQIKKTQTASSSLKVAINDPLFPIPKAIRKSGLGLKGEQTSGYLHGDVIN